MRNGKGKSKGGPQAASNSLDPATRQGRKQLQNMMYQTMLRAGVKGKGGFDGKGQKSKSQWQPVQKPVYQKPGSKDLGKGKSKDKGKGKGGKW